MHKTPGLFLFGFSVAEERDRVRDKSVERCNFHLRKCRAFVFRLRDCDHVFVCV